MEEFDLMAKTFQGLEEVLANELTALGANNIQIGRRVVTFTGDKEMMYRANFCLRTAVRVLKPIKQFKANDADEVYEAIKSIEWDKYLTPTSTFAVDSVVYSQEFRHSKFVAYRVKDAIVDYFREKSGSRPSVRIKNPDLRLNMHVAGNDCTLSLDSSGESLHLRGYRQEQVQAPLNEVLAAAMILMTGWNGETDFIDPMCGSGTLLIEAGLIARNIYPGIFRKEYAFEKWADFDRDLLDKIYNDDSHEREFNHKIYGYDIKNQAVDIANNNVKAAGLQKYITVQQQDFAKFTRPAEKSIIVTNPPYGERITTPDILGLYRMIGERLKREFTDNEAWILSYHKECFDEIGLKPSTKISLFNGSLECEFHKYVIFSGKFNAFRSEGRDIKTDKDRKYNKERVVKQHREFAEKNRDEESIDGMLMLDEEQSSAYRALSAAHRNFERIQRQGKEKTEKHHRFSDGEERRPRDRKSDRSFKGGRDSRGGRFGGDRGRGFGGSKGRRDGRGGRGNFNNFDDED
ncbi:MAG: methyltransferase [Bacteroidaceae bacterium]|nr:methyltransferase [Bacteroidaceae bacterium]